MVIGSALAAFLFIPKAVYSGVSCSGVDVGGKTYDKIVNALLEEFGSTPPDEKISLILDGKSFTLATKDIDVVYDYKNTALKALLYGRNGGYILRTKQVISALFCGYNLPLEFSYSHIKLENCINQMLEGIGTPVLEYSYQVKDKKLFLTNGIPGNMPDKELISKAIIYSIGTRNYEEELRFDKEERLPSEMNVDVIFDDLNCLPTDAYFERQGDEVVIVPHRYGIDFEKKKVAELIKENSGYGKTYEIPAIITDPHIHTMDLEKKLFSQTLGSYKTSFNISQTSRSANIYLASSKINNYIMMPGEEFSYNEVVGERTLESGFEIAHVYLNNEVADGIGGGICQVSSTLYCATLYANLKISQRVNHQLTVSYVPLGQDATIDYGNIDFKFVNNTEYPIKIVSRAQGAQIEVSIIGYREKTEKVEIYNATIATIPPTITEEKDPLLPIGEEKIITQGSYGSVVETYKVVTIDGIKGERKFVSKSSYGSGKTIVAVGTKPLEDIIKEDSALNDESIVIDTEVKTHGKKEPTQEKPLSDIDSIPNNATR